MAKFEAKFWGTKEKRGQLAKEVELLRLPPEVRWRASCMLVDG